MLKKLACFFILLALGLSPAVLSAQFFLSLEKPGTNKRIRYYEGDQIWYEVDYADGIGKGFITRIVEDTVDIEGYPVPLTDIIAMHRPRGKKQKWTTGGIAAPLFLGAILVPVGAVANINQYTPSWKSWTIVGASSLALAGTGLLIIKLHYRKYRLNKKWRLKTLYLPAIPGQHLR